MSPSYIQQDRHGGYHFVRKIPSVLRQEFLTIHFRKSLRTYHRQTAITRARRIAVYLDGVFDQMKKYQFEKRLAEAKASVADATIAEITADLERRLTPEQRDVLNDPSAEPDPDLQRLIDDTLDRVAQQERGKADALERQKEAAAKIQISDRLEQRQCARKLIADVESDYGTPGILTATRTSSATSTPEPEKESPPISECWERYRADKIRRNRWKTETKVQLSKLKEYDSQCEDLIEILGGDIPASRVDRATADQIIDGLVNLPSNRRKKWPGKSLAEIPAGVETISDNTANQRLDVIKGFWKFLVREEIIKRSSPFDGKEIEVESTNYATLAQRDIEQLFNLPSERIGRPWEFWIPRLALFSGARQSEIAQLRPEDIRRDDGSASWYFSLLDLGKVVKTAAGRRLVPIHQEVLDNGFEDYLTKAKSAGHDLLWPGLNILGRSPGRQISTYWLDLKTIHGFPSEPVDEQGRRKVFHSLRRTAINRLRQAGVSIPLIQAIVGHEPELGATKDYLDETYSIGEKAEALQKLQITGVSWRHPLMFKV